MDIMGVETLGYYDGEDIAACEASGVTCLAAKPRPGGTKKRRRLYPQGFCV